jgi:RimJ/RimL family protein N-acetyltransferase
MKYISNEIYMGALDESFVEAYARWTNDEEVTKFLFQGTFPTTQYDAERLFKSLTTSTNDVVFGIYAQTKIIGICGIHDINWVSRAGEFRVLIGETSYWGKHIGRKCLEHIIKLAFERYNLHKLWLGYNVENIGASKSYANVGMVYECTLKECHYRNGKYYDGIRMCMFSRDYKNIKATHQQSQKP